MQLHVCCMVVRGRFAHACWLCAFMMGAVRPLQAFAGCVFVFVANTVTMVVQPVVSLSRFNPSAPVVASRWGADVLALTQ
jgi:uncharacterized membrane protein